MQFILDSVEGLAPSDQTHWKIKVLVIETEGQKKSPALDALDDWGENQKADFKKIIKVMKRVGQTTRVMEPKHVKKSKNPKHENVYEMRADKGHARLMFFYSEAEQTAVAVCTNPYWKGNGNQDQAFDLCDQLRRQYEKQLEQNKK